MKIELIEAFLSTLLHSWGSDTPPEAVWAANDFLKIIEEQYNYTFVNSFTESYDQLCSNNYDVVLLEIKTLIQKL